MKKNILTILTFAVAFLFATTPSFAYEGEDIKAGTITTIKGSVSTFHRETGKITTVSEGDTIYQGDSLRTKSRSYAEVTLEDGSTLKIAQNSRIRITEFLLGDNGERKSSIIKLFRGKLRALVSKVSAVSATSFLKAAFGSSGGNFAVSTPTAVIGVKGTEFLAIHEKGRSSVFVDSGEVEYWNTSNPDSSVTVGPGFYSHAAQGSAPTKPARYTMAHAVINKGDTNLMSETQHSDYGGEENVANTTESNIESYSLDITESISGEDTSGATGQGSANDAFGIYSVPLIEEFFDPDTGELINREIIGETLILSGTGDVLIKEEPIVPQ